MEWKDTYVANNCLRVAQSDWNEMEMVNNDRKDSKTNINILYTPEFCFPWKLNYYAHVCASTETKKNQNWNQHGDSQSEREILLYGDNTKIGRFFGRGVVVT